MKILVTGGTGVIGTGAVPALLRGGHQVRLLSRHADREAPKFPEGVEAYVADIADPRPLRGAVAGCDVVIHIAGIVDEAPPEITFEKANVEGTREMLRAATAEGAPYFVFISSLGAERGASAYHQSKFAAEQLVRQYEGPWVILRPGSVYGPGDETISTLLKMVRTLPAVPLVEAGEQPFQPLWYADFAQAIAQVVERPGLAGQTLECAGTEVTTTDEVLARLADVTGKNPTRVPLAAWVARMGAQALDALGGLGKKLMQRAKIEPPVNTAKLTMLLEGSVIENAGRNAMETTFDVTLTPLQGGLETLAEMLPEQLPGEGVGAMKHATYRATIRDSGLGAAELIARICADITAVMPMEFAAEPGAPKRAEPGATLTADIRGRGHVQVRMVEKTETRATFVTLEGHPLAGVMQLHAEDLPGGELRFSVHTASQAANAVDWVAMRLFGDSLQAQNWQDVVRRVIVLSGGMSDGVKRASHDMREVEQRDLHVYLERLVNERQQEMRADAVRSG